jgi:ferrochelatase
VKYKNQADQLNKPESTGVLLVNLGTPDEPTTPAVRRYLAEFLRDPRVVSIPRIIWMLILHGIVLRIRPSKSAEAYQSVWTEEGSPLLAISRRQHQAIDSALGEKLPHPPQTALAMRYGNPSIQTGLEQLRKHNVQRLLVVPLYPQYSATTTASVFDAVSSELQSWRWLPELRFISHYHDEQGYISALAKSIADFQQTNGMAEKLLFSFHGIPKDYADQGDPYPEQCRRTASATVEKLGLTDDQWAVSFQSRFGKQEWVKPYTDQTLKSWGSEGLKSVQVVCPAFSADCLETLEEIAIENREYFVEAGGGEYAYIPALNDDPEHIEMLSGLILKHLQGWI